uniref:NAD(P)H-quinone oxidoreductase subunit 4L, chloroplastic n=1 Tax=Trichomanes trollii TaxID=1481379 RepID=A0A410YEN7_9MONI|nr:NADH-plastoquinone oxidoreductase subunit 4L [Trichomanes trollii]QAV57623.1 NADH-plastoquinone oxidoreductase subunit 4L [Trichomanes trollii]
MVEHGLMLGAFLYCIGFFGLITSRNIVKAIMCLELILNAVNINLVIFSNSFDSQQIKGEVFSIFIIAIAAAEATIGLSIALVIQRNRRSTRIDQFNLLKW